MDLSELINDLSTDWKSILNEVSTNYIENINKQISKDIIGYSPLAEVFPPKELILNAFNHFNFNELKVVIIGQDCYPTKGNAMGLCFSVPDGTTKCPASLRNIFKELEAEYGIKRNNPNLLDWAQQGVLMLNTALTVIEGLPGSHIKIWKDFTRDIISYIVEKNRNICFILWGEYAISYKYIIDEQNHYVLTHSHPSPLCRKPFVGNNHFIKCNDFLENVNKTKIKWV